MLIVIVKILFFFINIFLETTLKMFELNEKVQVFDSITSIWENGRVLSRTDSNSFVVNFESYSSKHESNVDVINIRKRIEKRLIKRGTKCSTTSMENLIIGDTVKYITDLIEDELTELDELEAKVFQNDPFKGIITI